MQFWFGAETRRCILLVFNARQEVIGFPSFAGLPLFAILKNGILMYTSNQDSHVLLLQPESLWLQLTVQRNLVGIHGYWYSWRLDMDLPQKHLLTKCARVQKLKQGMYWFSETCREWMEFVFDMVVV